MSKYENTTRKLWSSIKDRFHSIFTDFLPKVQIYNEEKYTGLYNPIWKRNNMWVTELFQPMKLMVRHFIYVRYVIGAICVEENSTYDCIIAAINFYQ